MSIQLGSLVRDTITGFEGTATGFAKFMYGCNRILIEANRLTEEGKIIEDIWFDEQRIETIKKQRPKVSRESSAKVGGPQHDANRGRE